MEWVPQIGNVKPQLNILLIYVDCFPERNINQF
jgi:hypothetical protein